MVTAAAILTLMLSYGVNARTTFQSSPVFPTPVTPSPVVTAEPAFTPEPAITLEPTVTFEPVLTFEPTVPPPPPALTAEPLSSTEPPAAAPLPASGAPTPTVAGFLPAPTIVNPNDLGSLPLAQPAITNHENAPEPTPANTANDDPGLQAGLALINLIWLICGGSLLIGGAVAILLLLRRSGRL